MSLRKGLPESKVGSHEDTLHGNLLLRPSLEFHRLMHDLIKFLADLLHCASSPQS